MADNKSLDESNIIAAYLLDVHTSYGDVFDMRACRLTLEKVRKRVRAEGIGFLTKTLPRLGKCLDKALTESTRMTASEHRFSSMQGSELPMLMGEFFSRVFDHGGVLLPHPCAQSIRVLRQFLYLFYKYELPYTHEQEQQVIDRFKRTEDDLSNSSSALRTLAHCVKESYSSRRRRSSQSILSIAAIAREARILLSGVLSSFDPTDIKPKHGPGAVATKQQLSGKYLWSNVCGRITDLYPFDAYFCASAGHVCDNYRKFSTIGSEDLPARVLLVPKDSRGPRLISCEPVDFQWIQQGIARSLIRLVERHPLTRFNVFFTDQQPNRLGALLGSQAGKYATLDLNEASDRVSVELVHLLFPDHICDYLDAARSRATVLPNGEILKLQKFAPMGSSLCFPIMALTIWAILTAAMPDTDTRESILVYGDDVIVPSAQAENAMMLLEAFGLKINRDKSCTKGLFRESCGMDAYRGIDVTPVRLRTVWQSHQSADVYTSWLAYANSFYDRRCYNVYNLIVDHLRAVYGPIPDESLGISCPSLRCNVSDIKRIPRRANHSLQKIEWKVLDVASPAVVRDMDGWSKLLRYFTESSDDLPSESPSCITRRLGPLVNEVRTGFDARVYTRRRSSILVRRWR